MNPTPVNQYNDITAARFGNKAASLLRLKACYVRVPSAWAIPCECTFTRPLVEFSNIPEGVKYAVRSSGQYSMPGQMLTVFVEHSDLWQATEQVWDSWNTSHCKAYREANGIPDTGTAVIYQQMIAAKYAGVAFTADPSKPGIVEYGPIIEYVEGLGDKLVSGTAQPKRVTSEKLNGLPYGVFSSLAYCLEAIHNVYGPSDCEWVVDQDERLYFVQQRTLKFAVVDASSDDARLGEVITYGRNIGAPTVKVGKVVTKIKEANGNVLWAGDFTPDMYEALLGSVAIICDNGGETCHAAIVARELGKPAISGISVNTIADLVGGVIAVNGKSGCLCSVKDGAEADELEHVELKTWPAQNINITKVSAKAFEADKLAYRFYNTVNSYEKGDITRDERNRRIDEIALVLATYCYVACLGEARHVYYVINKRSSQRTKYAKQLKKLGVCLPTHRTHKVSPDRADFVEHLPQSPSVENTAAVMKALKGIFNTLPWGGSFGGQPWGRIADTALQYFEGAITPLMFCDVAFNLAHNGGLYFGKVAWLYSGSYIKVLLDYKRKLPWSKTQTAMDLNIPELKADKDRHSIFQ